MRMKTQFESERSCSDTDVMWNVGRTPFFFFRQVANDLYKKLQK